MKFRCLYLIFAALVIVAAVVVSVRAGGKKASFEGESFQWPVMGTIAEFSSRDGRAYAVQERDIVAEAFREVERDLSVFAAGSLISRVNCGETVRMSADTNLYQVLAFALDVAKTTSGAFDPTVNPLMRAWGFRGGTPAVPSAETLSNVLSVVGWRHVVLVSEGDLATLSLDVPGAELDLGGIAKGYAVDLAFERLRSAGATNFMLNLGGNIRVSGGPSKERSDWTVAVRDPSGKGICLRLPRPLKSGEAVATSGSYERFVEIGGRRYSHIVDPRTGWPVENGLGSVSVVAPSAMKADAYSTALFVLGETAGREVMPGNGDCEVLFVPETK